jgi:hypothetical protein
VLIWGMSFVAMEDIIMLTIINEIKLLLHLDQTQTASISLHLHTINGGVGT